MRGTQSSRDAACRTQQPDYNSVLPVVVITGPKGKRYREQVSAARGCSNGRHLHRLERFSRQALRQVATLRAL